MASAVPTSRGDPVDRPDATRWEGAAGGYPPVPPLQPAPANGTDRRAATDAERKALASVIRLRILRLCLYEPLTNKQIAERLDRNPASVLHHVRSLVLQGFLAAEPVRPGPRGSKEVPYRATGKSWRLDFGTSVGQNTMLRTFFDEVALVPEDQVASARLGLQLSEKDMTEMNRKLQAVLGEYAAKPHDPSGKRVSLFLALHPEPT